jgi:hypothetical protein
VHESAPKVDVVSKADATGKTLTVPTESVTKVVIPIRKIKLNDLILCDDNGAEYQYVGGGKFSRTKTPTGLEQKRERDVAAIKAKKEREAAKAEEKKRQQELRKAEAARRDLEKIAEKERRKAEVSAKKEAARAKRSTAAAHRANKCSKVSSAKSTATTAKTHLVKVARIGDTQEFGVFSESCSGYTAARAVTIGARAVCEAERDRINNKRRGDCAPGGNVSDAAVMAELLAPTSNTVAEVPRG